MGLDVVGFADARHQLFRESLGARSQVRRAAQEQDREFVAADAGDDVMGAGRRDQAPTDVHQQLVADAVSEPVVHRLEHVEVDKQHANPVAAGEFGQRLGHAVDQLRPVEEAGQGVVARQEIDALHGPVFFRDVRVLGDPAAVRHGVAGDGNDPPIGQPAQAAGLLLMGRAFAASDVVQIAIGVDPARDAPLHDLGERDAGRDVLRRKIIESGILVIGDDDAHVAVEHAKALRQVGERRFELLGFLAGEPFAFRQPGQQEALRLPAPCDDEADDDDHPGVAGRNQRQDPGHLRPVAQQGFFRLRDEGGERDDVHAHDQGGDKDGDDDERELRPSGAGGGRVGHHGAETEGAVAVKLVPPWNRL